MGTLRNLAEYIRYDLEYNLKVPMRKDGTLTLGSPVDPTTLGISNSTKNTAIVAEFNRNAFVVLYNRVDASVFLTPSLTVGGGLPLTATSVKTTRDLVFDLNRKMGLALIDSDLVDEPVVVTSSTTEIVVKFSDSCLWFTGEVAVKLNGRYHQQNDTLIQLFDFDARPFVSASNPTGAGYQNGGLITYGTSYVDQTTALAAIPATSTMYSWENISAANGAALANAMKAVDGLPWNYATSIGAFNLYCGCVVYNGPVAGWNPRLWSGFKNIKPSEFWDHSVPRKDHTRVLVFCPNPNYGTNNLEYSPLFVHYGSIVDPAIAPEFKPPVHWWPLTDGDLSNHGSAAAPAWAPPVNFTINSNGTWAKLKAQGLFALGAAMDCTKDFTLSIKLMRNDYLVPNDSGAYEGLFTNSAAVANGSVISNAGWCYLNGAVGKWNDPGACNAIYHQPTRLTITKKASEAFYQVYLDDALTAEHTINNAYPIVLTHFGKGGAYLLKTTTEFCDIRFYDYCMTPDQVKQMNG